MSRSLLTYLGPLLRTQLSYLMRSQWLYSYVCTCDVTNRQIQNMLLNRQFFFMHNHTPSGKKALTGVHAGLVVAASQVQSIGCRWHAGHFILPMNRLQKCLLLNGAELCTCVGVSEFPLFFLFFIFTKIISKSK